MIYTFGHSTLSESEAVALLYESNITHLLDIRSHPGSHYVPHWDRESIAVWLPRFGISYAWYPELGGWSEDYTRWAFLYTLYNVDVSAYTRPGVFPKHHIARKTRPMPSPPCWTNQGLYDYSYFTALDSFQSHADHLAACYSGENDPHCAIMCSELLWWKCHRSMVADYLVHVMGCRVQHLQPRLQDHDPGDRILRYPARVREAWLSGQKVLQP